MSPASLTTRTASGDDVVDAVTVVTLADGRLGCWDVSEDAAARVVADPGVVVRLADDEPVAGTGTVVRSGRDYLEVRGRVLASSGPLARWRRRRQDVVVVLVTIS